METTTYVQLQNILGISNLELKNLLSKAPKIANIPLSYIEEKVDYLKGLGASESDIVEIAFNCTNIFFARPEALRTTINYFVQKYDLSSKETIQAIKSNMNSDLYFKTEEEIDTMITSVQTRLDLTDDIMKQLYIQTYCLSNENKHELLKQNLKVSKNYGIDFNKIDNNFSFLGNKTDVLELKLRLGMLGGYHPNVFIGNKHYYLSPKITYAMLMAKENKELAADTKIFASRKYLQETLNIDIDSFIQKYPLNDDAIIKINRSFEARFPNVIAAINGVKYTPKAELKTSPKEQTEAFIRLYQQNFQLSRGEIYNILNSNKNTSILSTTQEDINRNIAKLVGEYGFHYSLIGKLSITNPLVITAKDNKIDTLYTYLNEQYGLTKPDYARLLFKNASLYNSSNQELENYHNSLIENGLNIRDVKKLLLTTSNYAKQEAKEVQSKLLMLKLAGADKDTLDFPFTILEPSYDELETRIKIALLTNTDIKTLVNYPINMPIKKLWARYKSIETLGRTDLNPFSMAENLNVQNLYSVYEYSDESVQELDQTFKRKYPFKAERFDHLRKYLTESTQLDTQYLFKSEKEVYLEKIDTSSTLPKELKEYNIKRFMRLTGASEEDVKQLLSTNPNLLDDQTYLTNCAIFKSSGMEYKTFASKTKALALNPDKTSIRLKLAKLCGLSDSMYLNRYYAYDESKVYSKMCMLRALNLPVKFAYASTEDFETITKNTLKKCMEMFPFNESTQKYIEENYKEMENRASKNQGEISSENE